MLDVRDLTVAVDGRMILSGLDLHVSRGETVALFGPNGSGKTSLLNTLMGFPGYRIEKGHIRFLGRDITDLPVDSRARMGMGVSFQRPPAVRGVRVADLLAACSGEEAAVEDILRRLALTGFGDRELNLGFSGGEIKRSELAQLLAQRPTFIMFDEPDSGVDLDSISVVGRVIGGLLEQDRPRNARGRAGVIISHTGNILDYVEADRACVMIDGRLRCTGDPVEILEDIRTRGYEGCVRCRN